MRMMGGFFTVGFWTLASRILGFVRDVLIAAYLGTGPAHQAFVAAFTLPNLFRRFFAEGAFNMAFVPMFSKKLESGDDPIGFAKDAFSVLTTILIVLTVVAQLIMPWLIYAQVAGFAGTPKFDLAVDYGRIAFPYIIFISLAALLSGVLNSTGRFAAAAAAPVLLNILFISSMILAAFRGWDIASALIWTVPIAGVLQMALVWWAARRAGFTITLSWPRWTPELKRLAIIAAPAALAGGVVQINLLVGRQVASQFDKAISWLYNADRLYQLPLGVVGIAIGIVLLPELSRRLQADDSKGGQEALSRAGEMALALTLPSAVALLIVPMPLVQVLFERGLFTADDTAATALVVAIYGLGLPAFVLQKVLQPLFFARGNTKTPFYYALIAMVLNAVIAIGLAPFIGYVSAALATTFAGWAMFWLLWAGSRQMGNAALFDARFKQRLWRLIVASALMGACLLVTMLVIGPMFGIAGWRYLALLILVASGTVSYALFGHWLGAFNVADFRAAMRRR
ncbi:murein biosynthesis integral membrane protein MurJ [Pseudohalocynthiibacter aestuariivivens]|jgi:putative peptidoglycan lipid II flippase|uniref:Probable lipid II flippase MurJ n=1 Tax=Pseudohalocynthiibacter aestuariivivens TaxID=1591409 RepID=A0ABV5JAL1_9RHOB|nr:MULTISPECIES: murein biosynthesis integral membrane protein MurJ [Pseudohalocynthiibacter]MBS9715943.1 murein biosynthesis integral membrane protein MurJ [Pseudohalocynthiibacter aestuariivivens]MCK0102501.1 murein biosynthesis integral membrane protein MurJ [Pseudohalocynthiibacter sp. F2068]